MNQQNQKNELDERIVTIYKNTFAVNQPNYITVEKALGRIKNGKIKDVIEKIRTISDKKERDKLKASHLTAYNFQGKFTHRSNDGIHSMSGLIPLDFDHLEDFGKEWNRLIQDDYTFACFRSPSGDGIKVLVKVPPEFKNFKKYFAALRKYYNMEDYAGWDDLGDVSRLCFESYDPNLYYNPNSKVFDMMIKEQTLVREFSDDKEKLKEPNEIYRRVKTWAERTNDYYDGNKHRFLVYISSACNRFGLDSHFVSEKLVNDYQHKASPVDSKDIIDIVKRVYITYAEQHGNSFFNVDGEMNDFDPESPARDVIYLKDIKDAMIDSFLHGDAKGETTYFNAIDPHWRWKRGEITIMQGVPNHGKTTLMLQLMLVKSIKDGAKWGIFSPEQNPPIDFYKDLIHMYIGKSTESYHPNQMSLAEYNKGMEFINEHFYFVYPKNDQPTPQYINDRFEELIIKHSIDGCVIDPFNQLINEYSIANYRDDKYIEIFLSGEKRFALDQDIYKIIVCHPNGSIDLHTEKTADKDLKNEGNHKMPGQYDLAGGAMWFNKADNILCTYQPYYITRIKNSRRRGSTAIFETYKHPSLTQFVSQKIKKQKLIGVPGTANLYYDSLKARFYEELAGFEPGDDSKPYREKYCPFDAQYVLEDSMSPKETEVSETDWSAFKKTEQENQEKEEREKQQKEEKKYKEELKIDEDVWSNFANELNDVGDEDFDQIDGLDGL